LSQFLLEAKLDITINEKIKIHLFIVIKKLGIVRGKEILKNDFLRSLVYDSKRIWDVKTQLDIALLPAMGVMACNATWGNRRIATISSIDLWIHYFRRRIPAIPVPCKPTEENILDSGRIADITSTFIPRVRYYLQPVLNVDMREHTHFEHFFSLSNDNDKSNKSFLHYSQQREMP